MGALTHPFRAQRLTAGRWAWCSSTCFQEPGRSRTRNKSQAASTTLSRIDGRTFRRRRRKWCRIYLSSTRIDAGRICFHTSLILTIAHLRSLEQVESHAWLSPRRNLPSPSARNSPPVFAHIVPQVPRLGDAKEVKSTEVNIPAGFNPNHPNHPTARPHPFAMPIQPEVQPVEGRMRLRGSNDNNAGTALHAAKRSKVEFASNS